MKPVNVSIKPATYFDALKISYRMRPEDIREAADLGGVNPQQAVQVSLKASEASGKAYIAYVEDSPEVVFGVGQSFAIGVGHPWLLGSDSIQKYPVRFIKLCKVYVPEFLKLFPILTNLVDSRNTLHCTWLEFMGFKFIKDYPDYGPGRILARQFVLCA